MRRFHEERRVMARQMRVRAMFMRMSDGSSQDEVDRLQAGRYRKRKALGCGRARCWLCSGHKLFGEPSHKDRLRRLRADDSLRDYDESARSRGA